MSTPLCYLNTYLYDLNTNLYDHIPCVSYLVGTWDLGVGGGGGGGGELFNLVN